MDLLSPKIIKFLGIEPDRGAKELLNFNLRTLRYLGIWKWDVPHFKLNRAFAYLTIILQIIFNVSEIFSGYYNYNDLDHLTKLTISIVFIFLLIFKNMYIMFRMDEAVDLVDMLMNKFFTDLRPPTPDQLFIVNKYAARAKFFTIVRSVMALNIITFWLLAPIKDILGQFAEDMDFLDEDDDEEGGVTSEYNKTFELFLPFEAYYPFDVKENVLNYTFAYIFQSFAGLSVFIGMPAWDMLFVSIFIHATGHFRALQHVFFNLQRNVQQIQALKHGQTQRTMFMQKFPRSDEIEQGHSEVIGRQMVPVTSGNLNLDEDMWQTLNNCIQHHQVILDFVERLEGLLRPVMMMQLMASVSAFCVIGFQMSVIPISTESVKFVKLSVSLMSALIEQGMFYWFGGELLDESAKTLSAVYHCEWYSTDIRFRQNLRIMMERLKRPVKLTAGLSPLTLESFAGVVQSSYSYFTMLKAVHDEDED